MSCQLTCLWISHLIHDCDPLLKWEGTKQKRADVRRRRRKQKQKQGQKWMKEWIRDQVVGLDQ